MYIKFYQMIYSTEQEAFMPKVIFATSTTYISRIFKSTLDQTFI